MDDLELLSPVGDFERLKEAIHFKCDAVYLAGKQFGLRSFAGNFDEKEMKEALLFAHKNNIKVYVTVNVLAHNSDFAGMLEYLKFLESIKVDGVIVSDLGIASLVTNYTSIPLHVSTQANVTNIYSAKEWVKLGAKRLVLARELSLKEIKEIKDALPGDIEIECFVHGAMCISYSGRCLLSNYFTGRDSNKGSCAQPCRWNYALSVKDDNDSTNFYPIEEDSKGTYILNSKDLCLIEHLKELKEAGITSLKIEGRMKSPYYVATVTNAYRRALNDLNNNRLPSFNYIEELKKTSNRAFTTGFYFESDSKTNIETSKLSQTYQYLAVVIENSNNGYVLVEHRNKFKIGDQIEILSNDDNFDKSFVIKEILDLDENPITEVKKIKQKVYIKCPYHLQKYDILRSRIINEN